MGIFDLFKKKPDRTQNYLIEFRFSGYVKEFIKELKDCISENFHVTQKEIIPHITLVGPLKTSDEKRLITEVKNICKKYELIKFQLDGFGHFENRVIYVKIKPSDELKQLRTELAETLGKFCQLSPFDDESHFTFHATLVKQDLSFKIMERSSLQVREIRYEALQRKFKQILEYLQSWEIQKIEQYAVRITVLTERRKILAEYDLLQHKVLNRYDSLDRKEFKKTLDILDKKRDKQEFEFQDLTAKGKIHVYSDAHFDHRKIIEYCNRPFNSDQEMNQKLLANWNNAVGENETIYFLGDITYGRHRHSIDYWLGKVNGQVNYFRGNHDCDAITRSRVIPNSYGIKYRNYKFLLMHDPHRPFGYEDWIIHGDKHNNDLENYPFINQKNKTVNVCAELVDYTPLSLDTLIPLIESGRNYKTIKD